MSHGVPRVSDAEPRTEQATAKELQDITKYRGLVDTVNSKVRDGEYTPETLQLVAQLLTKNPEFYTIWNHRRRLLTAQLTASSDQITITEAITSELRFLFPLLLKFPKCYWIWNYRTWLLEQASELLPPADTRRFWQEELGLVGKMLSRDSRNFHGWGYRKLVVAALEDVSARTQSEGQSMVKSEFDYTTKMIGINLSNFSAWHNRSKLIPRLLTEQGADDAQRQRMLDSELELIHEALIDPYDQSLWFYHACLMSAFSQPQSAKSIAPSLSKEQRLQYLDAEMAYVLEMLEDEKDCKWIYQTLLQLATEYKGQADVWPEGVVGEDVGSWMTRLKLKDPLRVGRWSEMERQLSLE